MESTLAAPSSHQIRISPEKSEFDAKRAPSWSMPGRAARRGMRDRVRRVDFVAEGGYERGLPISSFLPLVSAMHLALQCTLHVAHNPRMRLEGAIGVAEWQRACG